MNELYTRTILLLITLIIVDTHALDYQTVEEHSKATLPCDSIIPEHFKSIQWYKSTNESVYINGKGAIASRYGGNTAYDQPGLNVKEDGSLVIFNATKESGGIYRCVGRESDPLVDPKYFDVKLDVIAGPHALTYQTVEEHSTAILPCDDIIPENFISIQWYKSTNESVYINGQRAIASRFGGNTVYDQPELTVTKDGSLVIFIATKESGGIYRCVGREADPSVDPQYFDVKLDVIGVPDFEATTVAFTLTGNDVVTHQTMPLTERVAEQGCMPSNDNTAAILLANLLFISFLLWMSLFSWIFWKYKAIRRDLMSVFKRDKAHVKADTGDHHGNAAQSVPLQGAA